MKSVKYLVTALFVLLTVPACTTYNDAIQTSFIGLSKFRQIKKNLYISPEIPSDKEQDIVKLISEARARIDKHFGASTSKPNIIVSSGEEAQTKFKLYQAPGKLLYAPWGNFIILDHDLANIDVLAHELVHAEIANSLGYLTRVRKMPTWLDEGIALQVDHRPQYAPLENIDESELKRVMSLNSPKLFWTKDPDQNIKNYQSAKAAVSIVVQPALEKKGLYGILEEIKMGAEIKSILGY